MNPSVTFDEAAGHEFHGNQWTGGGAGKIRGGVKIVNRMMSAVQDKNGNLKPDAGFTIDAHTKTDVTKGYAVDAFPHRSLEVDPSTTDRAGMKQQISDWIDKNSSLLSDPA